MEDANVTISLRIPKGLNDDLEKYARLGRYASKTELLREAIRSHLYESAKSMKGALKENAKPRISLSEWRAQEWKSALKQAKGDAKKAASLIDEKEKNALEGLRF